MENEQGDMNRALMLDGNAVAGLLQSIFAVDMTASPTECAHCGKVSEVGALWAFTHAPGAVLRCPVCEQVVMRVVETPDATYLDARGTAYLRLMRSALE